MIRVIDDAPNCERGAYLLLSNADRIVQSQSLLVNNKRQCHR